MSSLPRFLDFLNLWYPECDLRVLDVGARLGLVDEGYHELPRLNVLHLEGIEPDAEEARRILDDPECGPYQAVHPVAVAEVTGTKVLHLTALKGCTSLYPPNMETLRGHTAASWFEPVGTCEVDVVTLDDLFGPEARFDLVKIDVQGAELDVLRGGERLLEHALGISLEAQLHELYHGQALFPEVHRWMVERGFRLIHLKEESSFYNGEVIEANLVYVRSPDTAASAEDLLRRVVVALVADNRRYVELILREHGPRLLAPHVLRALLAELELTLDGSTLALLGPHN
jgi:FkbM family methyltransferase